MSVGFSRKRKHSSSSDEYDEYDSDFENSSGKFSVLRKLHKRDAIDQSVYVGKVFADDLKCVRYFMKVRERKLLIDYLKLLKNIGYDIKETDVTTIAMVLMNRSYNTYNLAFKHPDREWLKEFIKLHSEVESLIECKLFRSSSAEELENLHYKHMSPYKDIENEYFFSVFFILDNKKLVSMTQNFWMFKCKEPLTVIFSLTDKKDSHDFYYHNDQEEDNHLFDLNSSTSGESRLQHENILNNLNKLFSEFVLYTICDNKYRDSLIYFDPHLWFIDPYNIEMCQRTFNVHLVPVIAHSMNVKQCHKDGIVNSMMNRFKSELAMNKDDIKSHKDAKEKFEKIFTTKLFKR